MRRFFVAHGAKEGEKILLAGSEARHISRVLRLKKGDTILLFDNEGREYEAVIQTVGKRDVEVVITDQLQQDQKTYCPDIVIAQAVLKSDKMDLVIQKCTELGVARIMPFFSSRTIPHWSEETVEKKCMHWKRIVIASVKQSCVRIVPVVDRPVRFEQLIHCRDFDGFLKILCWEKESVATLKMLLKHTVGCRGVVALIGPEGGFNDAEVEHARRCNYSPAGLSPHILRAETTAIAFLAILHYELAGR